MCKGDTKKSVPISTGLYFRLTSPLPRHPVSDLLVGPQASATVPALPDPDDHTVLMTCVNDAKVAALTGTATEPRWFGGLGHEDSH